MLNHETPIPKSTPTERNTFIAPETTCLCPPCRYRRFQYPDSKLTNHTPLPPHSSEPPHLDLDFTPPARAENCPDSNTNPKNCTSIASGQTFFPPFGSYDLAPRTQVDAYYGDRDDEDDVPVIDLSATDSSPEHSLMGSDTDSIPTRKAPTLVRASHRLYKPVVPEGASEMYGYSTYPAYVEALTAGVSRRPVSSSVDAVPRAGSSVADGMPPVVRMAPAKAPSRIKSANGKLSFESVLMATPTKSPPVQKDADAVRALCHMDLDTAPAPKSGAWRRVGEEIPVKNYGIPAWKSNLTARAKAIEIGPTQTQKATDVVAPPPTPTTVYIALPSTARTTDNVSPPAMTGAWRRKPKEDPVKGTEGLEGGSGDIEARKESMRKEIEMMDKLIERLREVSLEGKEEVNETIVEPAVVGDIEIKQTTVENAVVRDVEIKQTTVESAVVVEEKAEDVQGSEAEDIISKGWENVVDPVKDEWEMVESLEF